MFHKNFLPFCIASRIFSHTMNNIEKTPAIIAGAQENERGIHMSFFHSKKNIADSALMAELAKTKLALDTAYSNFENVIDPDLIDCSIYEVNAIQQRYKYLLRQLKLSETPAISK